MSAIKQADGWLIISANSIRFELPFRYYQMCHNVHAHRGGKDDIGIAHPVKNRHVNDKKPQFQSGQKEKRWQNIYHSNNYRYLPDWP